MAHALARKTLAQMAEPEAEPRPTRPQADPALTFSRLATSVRQAIALEARIAAGPEAPRRPQAARWPAPRRKPAPPNPEPVSPPDLEPAFGLDAENPFPSLLQTLYRDLQTGILNEDEPDGPPIHPAWIPPLAPQSTGPPL